MNRFYTINSFIVVFLTAFLVAFCKLELAGHFPIDLYSSSFNEMLNYVTFSFSFFSVIVSWFFITILFHYTTFFFDAQGSFYKLLIHSGYGYFPLMIYSFVLFFLIEDISGDYLFLKSGEYSVPEIKKFLSEDNKILFLRFLSRFAQLLLLIWVVWGIKKYYGLSVSKSLICVFIPLILIGIFLKYL